MLAQHPTNTAHLQSRSQQQLLPNLQQIRSPILTSHPPLLNQHQFLGQPTIAWSPNQSPMMVPNPLGQFVLNTPTLSQILLPNQQSKEPQFLQAPVSSAGKLIRHAEEEVGDSASSGSETEKTQSNQLKAEKRTVKERKALKNRQSIGSKVMRSQTKKLRITYKPGHKSTQQMNDELLMFEAQRNADSGSAQSLDNSNSGEGSKDGSRDGSRDGLRTIKRKLKSEKKKISIVKPRVVITHKVNEYFIQESDRPFPVDDKQAFEMDEPTGDAVNKPKNADQAKTKDGKKLRKYRKLLKTKSTVAPNAINGEPTDEAASAIKPGTSKPQLVELSDDDQNLAALSATENGIPPVDEPKASSSGEARNETENDVLSDVASIYRWSVDDVYQFALETTSNEEFVTALKREQFDGQSLALLTIQHLRNDFDLKLGPTLLLNKKIESYKKKSSPDELSDCLPASGANIYKWSVGDVYSFVQRLTCQTIADEFERQEMDGHSLTLISCDNIRNDLNIPFGPALKIITKISELKAKAVK